MSFQSKVSILGAGMTKFMRRAQETGKELAFEAAQMALQNANLTMKDIDCVISVSAPDAFDGVHMKGEYYADGAGAYHKPYMRSYVGGGSGVFSIIHGWYHIASGNFNTCLVVAEEKMSSCQPHPQGAFNAIYDQFTERPLGVNLLWIFSLEMHRYMKAHNISLETIAKVSVKNKKNAMAHPCAQEGIAGDFTVEDVLNSEVIAYPVHRMMVSPVSDAACAVVLASEQVTKKMTDRPVWVEGVGWCLDSSYWTNRDLYYPKYIEYAARAAYKMAGITEPKKEIHLAEVYDPFAYKELHHMEGLLLADKGEAPKLLEKGVTQRNGSMPISPSGGLLGVGNPIAAAGLMKVIEIFLQLRGEAGDRQVDREVKRGLAQAWGDLMQVGTVVVLGK